MNYNDYSIECEFIALSDEFSIGQFGKINLLGLNPGESLSVPQLPYQLISTIVIQGVMRGYGPPQNISLGILYKDLNGLIFSSNIIHYPPIISNNHKIPLTLVLPFQCNLMNYGNLECILLTNGSRIKTKAFQIIAGTGPCLNYPISLTSSGTIHERKGFDLNLILKGANTSLIIIDQYLKPQELANLINSFPNIANVRLLTNPKSQDSYKQALKEITRLKPFPQVRFSRKFHDRFMIVNGSEYYHFGHSLKDLLKGRISRYSKLYGLEEINELKAQFEVEWEKSKSLFEE